MSPVSRGIAAHASPVDSLHRVVDAVLIASCTWWTLGFTPGVTLDEWLALSAAAILVHQTVSELSGLYRSWRGSRVRRELACILLTWRRPCRSYWGWGC